MSKEIENYSVIVKNKITQVRNSFFFLILSYLIIYGPMEDFGIVLYLLYELEKYVASVLMSTSIFRIKTK